MSTSIVPPSYSVSVINVLPSIVPPSYSVGVVNVKQQQQQCQPLFRVGVDILDKVVICIGGIGITVLMLLVAFFVLLLLVRRR